MKYLSDLGLNPEEINLLESSLEPSVKECVIVFPTIVKANYNYLKNLGVHNYKEIFLNHTRKFIINPDRFKAIFEKYDRNDLIRCLEKNGSVIEKL